MHNDVAHNWGKKQKGPIQTMSLDRLGVWKR